MKILYLSCHEVLEYDEIKLFTELGHEVFSLHGAYQSPDASSKRPSIPNMYFSKYGRALELGLQCTREKILPELLDLFDVTICMHMPGWIVSNWENFRGRRVIFRSIGQSVSGVEALLAGPRSQGLQIVRYSPYEAMIPGFVGSDAMIRFGKDPNEYNNWVGGSGNVVNFTQSLKGRGSHCGYNELVILSRYAPFELYGPGNEDITGARGAVSYEEQIRIMQTCSGYIAAGTHPASYTLNFIEAWMTGCPMIVFGHELGSARRSGYPQDTFEVPDLINHGYSGLIANNVKELIAYSNELVSDPVLAEQLSNAGRGSAIELFGVDKIRRQWGEFLG